MGTRRSKAALKSFLRFSGSSVICFLLDYGLFTLLNSVLLVSLPDGTRELCATYGARIVSAVMAAENATADAAAVASAHAAAEDTLRTQLQAGIAEIKAARDAGLLVIALDTPLDPVDAADATFATDNFQAGLLIGQWAKATMGDKAADAKIALLDLARFQEGFVPTLVLL